MKLKKSLLCAALLVGVSSAAVADFSGFYIGPQISYSWANTSVKFAPDNTYTTSDTSFPALLDGFTVGPHLGWAFEKNSWVYALEGSYNGGSFTAHENSAWLGGDASEHTDTQVNKLFTLTPLIGYHQNNWLIYGKAGYISGNVEVDSSANVSDSNISLSNSQRQYGWTAGSGVAYQFSEKQSIGIEYDYAHLGSTDFNSTTQGDVVVQEQVTVQPINMNTVSLVYTRYFW